MSFKILWSKQAELKLDEIFIYYGEKAGLKVASKITKGIIRHTLSLKEHPFIGQVEPLLEGSNETYRYLVFTNYKIIYSVDEKHELVKVATVFDVRQNPNKLLKESDQ